MNSIVHDLHNFFATGGVVLYALLFLMIAILTLIIDRYIFLFWRLKVIRNEIFTKWQQISQNRNQKFIKQQMVNRASIEIHGAITLLKYLLGLAPLLGLLGTVSGMISVFDAMGTFGTSNVKPIAAGISQATIPTMIGMVIAIIGLWFDHNLHGRIHRELHIIQDEMT
ncbi:MAG: MotA/TolQ/ExbB proton channel family protein [Gammaproteobacteria bacterium]|nr:MAG: MotA/TolQ/ExbB proton channel family protein [Gammaproteobacteria bacterium]